MRVGALSSPAFAEGWSRLRSATLVLLSGLVLLGLLFRDEIGAALQVWSGSTAYNHCFLVLPLALYLAWDRRALLADVPIRPAPWAALGAIPLGVAWLAAERLGIMEGRQLVLLGFVQLLFLAVLGWRLWRALAAPLLYLFFLVPFGAFVVPALQRFTVWFAVSGLDLLGIPNFVAGNTIEIPEGSFAIVEACAGLRFLIASIAFGVLYACLMYRSPLRRLLFVAASMVIPVIANGFRALGIIVLGHLLGSAEAAATDHVLYGWVFFSLIILLLSLLGAAFRQTPPAPPARRHRPAGPPTPQLLVAAVSLVALTAVWPLAAVALGRSAKVGPAAAAPVFVAGPGCSPAPGGGVETARSGTHRGIVQHFTCDGELLTARAEVFSPRVTLGPVLAVQRQLAGELDEEATISELAVPGIAPRLWRLVDQTDPPRTTATALWIGGQPVSGGLLVRARQAWNSIVGSPYAPVLIAITTAARPGARQLVSAFLAAQPALAEQGQGPSPWTSPLK